MVNHWVPPLHINIAYLLLLVCLLPSTLSFHIIESLSNSVEAGEVVHYTVAANNPVVVVLVSEVGDVDLYASPTHINSKPSSENHEISSASCGLDILPLLMDSDLKKYTLGVYGHVRYQESSFSLYMIQPSEADIRSYQVMHHDVPEAVLVSKVKGF